MEFKKITKTQAIREFSNKKSVYILPNKVRVPNDWLRPQLLDVDEPFDKQVNNYEYYNCIKELGRRCAFFIAK